MHFSPPHATAAAATQRPRCVALRRRLRRGALRREGDGVRWWVCSVAVARPGCDIRPSRRRRDPRRAPGPCAIPRSGLCAASRALLLAAPPTPTLMEGGRSRSTGEGRRGALPPAHDGCVFEAVIVIVAILPLTDRSNNASITPAHKSLTRGAPHPFHLLTSPFPPCRP